MSRADTVDVAVVALDELQSVMTPAQFRPGTPAPSDTEDLFEPEEYLACFNRAYAKELGDKPLLVGELPPGDRIIERIERALTTRGAKLRPSGGFNHYLPAMAFAQHPPAVGAETLGRFEALFKAVNAQL